MRATVARFYGLDASSLAPEALRELHILTGFVRAEERLREDWHELSVDEVQRLATITVGEARADYLAAKKALQVMQAKQAREGRF